MNRLDNNGQDKVKAQMGANKLTVEVLVPKTFVWWTFLALATDSSDHFGQLKLKFVTELSGRSHVVIVHSNLLDRLEEIVGYKPSVVILLWDGYQSYLDRKNAIDTICRASQRVEMRVVGDLWSGSDNQPLLHAIRHLFIQHRSAYNKRIFSLKEMKRFEFPNRRDKLLIKYRPKLMTLKVLMQLLLSNRLMEYRRTEFVYCGSTGLETLQKFAGEYGIDPDCCIQDLGGIRCESAFLVQWVAAIARNKGNWAGEVVLRALLRLIAIRKLREVAGREIFLNIYPEANINSYQAEMLFRQHVFLDFGGINGDEAFYPRSADIAIHKRLSIRFDLKCSIQRARGLTPDNVGAIVSFIGWYEEHALSTLRGCPARLDSC